MTFTSARFLAVALPKDRGGNVAKVTHNGARGGARGAAAFVFGAALTLAACTGSSGGMGSSGHMGATGEAGPGSEIWSHRYGDQSWVEATRVAVGPAGNVAVAGIYSSTVDLGCGTLKDVGNSEGSSFVAELDPGGACLWSHGLPNALGMPVVAVDPSGTVVVAGSFESWTDFGGGTRSCQGVFCSYLAAYDAKGALLWTDVLESLGWLRLAFDAAGNLFLAGNFTGERDLGGGTLTGTAEYNTFVAKFAPGGAHLWSKGFPGPEGLGVAVDASGAVVVAGSLDGPVDFGGGMIAGTAGVRNGFVAKLDAGGAHLWSKAFASPSLGDIEGVATDPAGAVILTGAVRGPTDFGAGPVGATGTQSVFLAKLDPGGAHVWSQAFVSHGTFDSSPKSAQLESAAAVDSSGNIFVHGWLGSSLDLGGSTLESGGTFGFFLASFDLTGKSRWAKAFGASGSDLESTIALDPSGNPVLAGTFVGTVDFGGGPLVSAGGTVAGNAYVAKLAR